LLGGCEDRRMKGSPLGFQPTRFDAALLLRLLLLAAAVGWFLVYGLEHPALLTIAFVVLAVLALLALTHVVLTVLRVQYQGRWGRTRSLPAAVARKWTQAQDFGTEVREGSPVRQLEEDLLGEEPTTTPLFEYWDFWIAFDVRGQEEEFRLPEALYTELEEGMTGVLTSRGERLLSFLPTEPPKPNDDPAGPSPRRHGG
jgi:hypothetical protein